MHRWIDRNVEHEFSITKAGEQYQQLRLFLAKEGATLNWIIKCDGRLEVNHKFI